MPDTFAKVSGNALFAAAHASGKEPFVKILTAFCFGLFQIIVTFAEFNDPHFRTKNAATMKIALAQLNYTIGDIEGNSSKMIDAIRRAKDEKADLVLFAEQAVSGTPAFDLLRKTTFLELCEDALERIASHCDTIAAIVGSPVLTAEGTISAAVVMEEGRVQHCIGKKRITARREMGFLTSGEGVRSVTIKGHKCVVVVGDDMRFETDYDHSAELVISINARKYYKGGMTYRLETLRHAAFAEGKEIVLVNQVGGSTEIVYDGTSGVVNRRGELVLLMKSFEEDFRIYDTEAEHTPLEIPKQVSRTYMVYEAACCGLRDFFFKNGYRKACIGLSGGIDSAVVACIAVEALGRENVRALLMPSPFTTEASVEDARMLAQRLGIAYDVIPISDIYAKVLEAMDPVIGGIEFDFTEENIQTRIRTVLLMAFTAVDTAVFAVLTAVLIAVLTAFHTVVVVLCIALNIFATVARIALSTDEIVLLMAFHTAVTVAFIALRAVVILFLMVFQTVVTVVMMALTTVVTVILMAFHTVVSTVFMALIIVVTLVLMVFQTLVTVAMIALTIVVTVVLMVFHIVVSTVFMALTITVTLVLMVVHVVSMNSRIPERIVSTLVLIAVHIVVMIARMDCSTNSILE